MKTRSGKSLTEQLLDKHTNAEWEITVTKPVNECQTAEQCQACQLIVCANPVHEAQSAY